MPRTARASVGDICYHVINRGNAQIEVFHKDRDYRAFVELIGLACQRIPMRVLAYCAVPNHFHLALWRRSDKDLGRWMQWLLTAHVRRYHQHYRSRVTRGRDDSKLFLLSRMITCSRPGATLSEILLRASLVEQAENWRWSSLHYWRTNGSLKWIDPRSGATS